MIVVVAELGNMYQPFDIDIVEFDEQAKTGDGGHGAVKLVADLVLHILAFQPVHDAVACGIRSPLRHGTMFTKVLHIRGGIRVDLFFREGTGIGLLLQMPGGFISDQETNRPMNQQIGVTTNR